MSMLGSREGDYTGTPSTNVDTTGEQRTQDTFPQNAVDTVATMPDPYGPSQSDVQFVERLLEERKNQRRTSTVGETTQPDTTTIMQPNIETQPDTTTMQPSIETQPYAPTLEQEVEHTNKNNDKLQELLKNVSPEVEDPSTAKILRDLEQLSQGLRIKQSKINLSGSGINQLGSGNTINIFNFGGQSNVPEVVQATPVVHGEPKATTEPKTPSTSEDPLKKDEEKKKETEQKPVTDPDQTIDNLRKKIKELEDKLKSNKTPKEESDPIVSVATAANNLADQVETTVEKIQKNAAEAVAPLSEEEKKEFEAARKTKSGFTATIERMFKGDKWKGVAKNALLSLGSALAVSSVGGAIATSAALAPIAVPVLSIGMAAIGTTALVGKIKEFRKIAKNEGISIKELVKKQGFIKGALFGTFVSGTSRAAAFFVPGVGSLAASMTGVGIETYASLYSEKKANEQQQLLIEKFNNEYKYRRYSALKENGYITREGVNIDAIIKDTTAQDLTADRRKTAQKAAIASLKYLYDKTKDDKYKFLHYTVKENDQDVRKEIDITSIGLQPLEGSRDEYTQFELTGVNFESICDTLDIEELKKLTLEASNHQVFEDKKTLTKDLVSIFVGLESADVENILSKEREEYLQSVAFLAGLRLGSGVVNSLTIIGAGINMLDQTYSDTTSQTQQGTTQENTTESEFRTELNDADANVDAWQRDDGSIVTSIDLDADGDPDLLYDSTTNQYSATSVQGAEKLFEIQNPELGNISEVSEFGSSSTGIEGTLVTESGEVVGVVYNGEDGGYGVLNNEQLESVLKVSIDGKESTFSINSINANGDINIQVGDQVHTTNLATISGLEGTTGTETVLITDPLMNTTSSGDSVPSILTKIMTQAKEFNPNLNQYDDYELQRELYRGNVFANDATIRSELGFGNPVEPNTQYSVRNSETILGWLEKLNGGPLNLPDVGQSVQTTEGASGLAIGINLPQISTISIDGLSPMDVDAEVAGSIPHSALAATITGLASFFVPNEIGNVVKTATIKVEEQDFEPEPIPVNIEGEKEYIRRILKTQVFGYSRTKVGNKFEYLPKLVEGTSIKIGQSTLTVSQKKWVLNDEPISTEELDKIVDALLALEVKDQTVVLTDILEKMPKEKRIKLSDTKEFRKVFKGDLKDGEWVEFTSNTRTANEQKETITSAILADRILLIKRDDKNEITGERLAPPTSVGQQTTAQGTAGAQTTTQSQGTTQTTAQATTGAQTTTQSQGTAQTTAQATAEARTTTQSQGTTQTNTTSQGTTQATATVSVEELHEPASAVENKESEKKDAFITVVGKMMTMLQTRNTPISINGLNYKYHSDTKIWHLDSKDRKAPRNLTRSQIFSKYLENFNKDKKEGIKTLETDVTTMLERLQEDGTTHGKPADKITISTTTYTRIKGKDDKLVWRGNDTKNQTNNKVLSDQELASRIVELGSLEAHAQANTEQADKNEEKEKPEKKSKRWLKTALIVGGVATGIAGSSITIASAVGGIPFVPVASTAVLLGSSLRKSYVENRREKLMKEVSERTEPTFTEADKKKLNDIEKILDIHKRIGELAIPMAISSTLWRILAPKITEIGLEVKIKTALKATWEKITVNILQSTEALNSAGEIGGGINITGEGINIIK